MGLAKCIPTIALLCDCVAFDKPLRVKVDETHAVIVPRDGGVGRQDGVLAVGAEHFG